MIARLRGWWKEWGCAHTHEKDTQIAGTRCRVRYCPGCGRLTWVD